MVAGRVGAVSRRAGGASVGSGGKASSRRAGVLAPEARGAQQRRPGEVRTVSCKESRTPSASRIGSCCASRVGSAGSRSGSWTSTRSGARVSEPFAQPPARPACWGEARVLPTVQGSVPLAVAPQSSPLPAGGAAGTGRGPFAQLHLHLGRWCRVGVGMEKGGPHITMYAWISTERTRPMSRLV